MALVEQALRPSPAASSTLTARVIGSIEIQIDHLAVTPVESRRGRQLLARLLVAAPRPVPATRLATDLWGDLPPERARACLHTTVSRVRGLLRDRGFDLIRNVGDSYSLGDQLDAWVDIVAFRRDVAEARLAERDGRLADAATTYQRALVLARGDLLADEPAMEWIDAERRVFAREVAEARTRLIELHLIAGRPDSAAIAALVALKEEPADERMSQLLIRAYVLLGHRRLALVEYWRLNRVLEHELGVAPTAETWALVRDFDRG